MVESPVHYCRKTDVLERVGFERISLHPKAKAACCFGNGSSRSAVAPNTECVSTLRDAGFSTIVIEDHGQASSPTFNCAELLERNKKSLVKIVQDSIGDQWWQPNGKGSIRILRNRMIVSQSLLGFKLMADAGK